VMQPSDRRIRLVGVLLLSTYKIKLAKTLADSTTLNSQVETDDVDQTSSTSTGPDSSTAAASNTGRSSGGVSTTTLAVAVAVPIEVLLLAFAGIMWLGIRKGCFVKKAPRDGSDFEKTGVKTRHDGSGKPTGGNDDVRELHADDRPQQLDFTPVHELQGGEDGRRYGVRD
jgi:hypothetical protein